MNILDKAKELIKKLNEQGVPLPMVRVNGAPTLTGTLVVLSFTTALLGQLGKLAHFFGNVDLANSNYLFGIALSAYLGRKMMGSKDSVTIEKDEDKK
jgi:hypothetical protein